MQRIAIAGTDSPHAEKFIQYLNIDKSYNGFRVVALTGGRTKRNLDLAAAGKIEKVVDDPEELVDDVDAAIVTDLHGGLHRQNAVPFLSAGKHVYVNKPCATTVADVKEIIEAARRGNAILACWAAMRFIPGVVESHSALQRIGPPRVVFLTGPADPDSPYGGLSFYGCHTVEGALEILGNPDLANVRVARVDHSVTITCETESDPVTQLVISLVRCDHESWQTMMIGRGGVVARDLGVPSHGSRNRYLALARGLEKFLDTISTGKPLMPYEQFITPVRLFEDIASQDPSLKANPPQVMRKD
ncbi:Gfo/Idh/MocA family oxidoreductase [Phytoactinopolyspora mesophila]|uniref:Gfo/Idh/MocA family oxidoreductase n=1 Tax=Phytoactinopolyspora mesophila TaxID=2650750 RepID=UPI0013914B3E